MKFLTREKILKNGQKVVLRESVKGDAKAFLDYMRKIGGESDNLSFGFEGIGIDVTHEEEYISRVHAAPNAVMLVAEIDGVMVGDCSITAEGKSRFSHNAELGIAVIKDYWHLGIGSFMMEAIIDFAKETKHIKNVNLTVMAENVHAIEMYKKFGFVEVGRHKNFSRVGNRYLDAVLMDLMI